MISKVWKSISEREGRGMHQIVPLSKSSGKQGVSVAQCESSLGRMMELEIEFERGCATREQIVELIELYSRAVEAHEAEEDGKYHLYQRRLQIFLKRPEVHAQLSGKSAGFLQKRVIQTELAKAHLNAPIEAQKLIDTSLLRGQNQKNKIDQLLHDQETHLEARRTKRALSQSANQIQKPQIHKEFQLQIPASCISLAQTQNQGHPKLSMRMAILSRLKGEQKD